MRWEEKQMETKERKTRHRMQSERGTEQAASWCISGKEKLVSAEDRRHRYGNGWLAASLADCKQDLGKAYSLWSGPQSLASLQYCVELLYSHGPSFYLSGSFAPTCPNSTRE